ncbi:MAG: TetR/AcrR family transcriptional regulator [Deltaproteobacteria bacterium]|nr:TetR/AcrR family transcriptional regulator [Deltaproteobacteria bacterium]
MVLASVLSPPRFEGVIDQQDEPVRRILDAAEVCVARSGYGGMSVRDVAQEAGVSKSLVHYHFLSKEHLFLELQVRAYNRLAHAVVVAVSAIDSRSRRTVAALDAVFEALRAHDDLPVLAEIWVRSLTDERLRLRAVALGEFLRQVIADALDALWGDAAARMPFSVATAAELLLSALIGIGLHAGIDRNHQRVDDALDGLRTVVGLALQSASKAPPRRVTKRGKR